MTRSESLLAILQKGPISTKELETQHKLKQSVVHSSVYDLKKQGYKIVSKKGKYHFLGLKVNPSATVNSTFKHPKMSIVKDPRVMMLSEKDSSEYYEMTKKALFYTKAAEALLNATEEVERMRK